MSDLFLGVDAGSSVCKAALYDASGHEIATAAERTPLSRPRPGWVEADPELAWVAVTKVIRAVVAQSRGRVRAIGLSGAMVGAWFVDGTGRAIRPGINWEDSRTQGLLEAMERADPGFLAGVFAQSGSVLQQGCTLPLLAWFARTEPETLARAAHVLSYKDYLRLRLTGLAQTDAGEASVIPGDTRAQDRSPAMIKRFGLGPHTHLLPPVRPAASLAGGLTTEASAATGLPTGLPVAVGTGDVIANVIGAGGLRAGSATMMLGTTCMLGLCHDRPVFEPPMLGLLFALPERHWFRAMVNVAGTLNLDWALSLLCPDLAGHADRFTRAGDMAAAEQVGARGVTYLPYLSESGIIAPVASARARAQFCGLNPAHRRESLLRAVYEGVAFAVADMADLLALPVGAAVVVTGGGGRSALWCRMIAEVLGREVVVPEGAEFGARGAALLAATALGVFPSVAAASAAVAGGGRRHIPTGADAAAWAGALARYRDHRDRLLG